MHAAEWLITPDEAKRHHCQAVLRFLGQFAVRGFSARYGEALAEDRSGWLTRLMLAEMRHTRMEEN